MITRKAIESIYKRYHKRPASPDELNIGLLFEPNLEKHHITIDDDTIIIGSVPTTSPFHAIPLDRVHAIIEFDLHVAIVLHASIIFLRKDSDQVDIHVDVRGPSFWERLRMVFAG